MKLEIYKPLWGHEGDMAAAVSQAVESGFDGIEGPVPEEAARRRDFEERLRDSGLNLIAEVTTGGGYVPDPRATPERHLDDLRRGMERSLPLRPKFVNTQAGLDAWDFSTQVEFHQKIVGFATEYGIDIAVETHRSRSTFHPWVTRALLDAMPDLMITCDFSHWCCVAERLVMDDDPSLLQLMAEHCRHIHARVGYDQGPQVPDPRAPEYAVPVAGHRAWWEHIWRQRSARGEVIITMTPEFGTDGYLHLEPHTQRPVADLWEVNRWMGERLREWFRAANV